MATYLGWILLSNTDTCIIESLAFSSKGAAGVDRKCFVERSIIRLSAASYRKCTRVTRERAYIYMEEAEVETEIQKVETTDDLVKLS